MSTQSILPPVLAAILGVLHAKAENVAKQARDRQVFLLAVADIVQASLATALGATAHGARKAEPSMDRVVCWRDAVSDAFARIAPEHLAELRAFVASTGALQALKGPRSAMPLSLLYIVDDIGPELLAQVVALTDLATAPAGAPEPVVTPAPAAPTSAATN